MGVLVGVSEYVLGCVRVCVRVCQLVGVLGCVLVECYHSSTPVTPLPDVCSSPGPGPLLLLLPWPLLDDTTPLPPVGHSPCPGTGLA